MKYQLSSWLDVNVRYHWFRGESTALRCLFLIHFLSIVALHFVEAAAVMFIILALVSYGVHLFLGHEAVFPAAIFLCVSIMTVCPLLLYEYAKVGRQIVVDFVFIFLGAASTLMLYMYLWTSGVALREIPVIYTILQIIMTGESGTVWTP